MNHLGNTGMPIKDPSLGMSTKNPSITENFNKPYTDKPQPQPSTSGSAVGETNPPPPPPPSKTATQRCESYISLNSKIKDQCKKYFLFHPNQKFGAFPDMYKPHHTYPDEKQPTETTSHFFRGGITTTMAVFEAFIVELLEEAKKKISEPQQTELKDHKTQGLGKKPQPKKDEKKSPEELQATPNKKPPSKKDKKNKSPEEEWQAASNKVIFHVWKKAYEQILQKRPDQNDEVTEAPSASDVHVTTLNLTDYLLCHPMKYHYVIQDEKVSTLEIGLKERKTSDGLDQRRQRRLRELSSINSVDESSICAILRLFYGIRCVMAHGISDKTLETTGGALQGFPHCKKCHGKETQVVLEASKDLEEYCSKILNAYESKPKKENVENTIRRIPCEAKFHSLKEEMGMEQSLTAEEWEDCFKILDRYFSKPKEENLAAPFAFFHMCRVERWLRGQKTNMYITYRMLVRVNQFIHTLALQLTLAVAKILIDVHELQDGFWAIESEDYFTRESKITPEAESKLIAIKRDNIPKIIEAFEKRQREMVAKTKEIKETSFNPLPSQYDLEDFVTKTVAKNIIESDINDHTWTKVVAAEGKYEQFCIKTHLVIECTTNT